VEVSRLNLNQLRYFLSIANTGSVTRSAEELNLTQPALTRGIKNLEDELGVELFKRLPRAMLLTRFGDAFFRHAQSIFVQLENAQSELQHLAKRTDDEIVIGAGPTWLMGRLPQILTDVLSRFPGTGISVRSGFDQYLREMLRSGEVDLVLTEVSSDPDNSDLVQESVISAKYAIVCGENHPLASSKKVKLAQLLNYGWALPNLAVSAQERLTGLFGAQGIPAPTPLVRSDSLDFILRILETSDVLSFVVESTIGPSRGNTVVAIDIDHDLPIRHAGIVLRRDSWMSPVTTDLIETIRADSLLHPWQ
jgi:DNA-binding transcriptional LysR family regulator